MRTQLTIFDEIKVNTKEQEKYMVIFEKDCYYRGLNGKTVWTEEIITRRLCPAMTFEEATKTVNQLNRLPHYYNARVVNFEPLNRNFNLLL